MSSLHLVKDYYRIEVRGAVTSGLMKPDASSIRTALNRLMADKQLSINGWAIRAGITEGALRSFLRGRSATMKGESLERLARAADVSVATLYDEAPPIRQVTQIVGYVGAGAEVFPIDDHEKGAGLDDVPMPPHSSDDVLVGVRVRGDSMRPAYLDNDVLFYRRGGYDDWRRYFGKDCVVMLDDGRSFVKMLRPARGPTRATLVSHNADDIPDVRLEWAAPVRWVMRT